MRFGQKNKLTYRWARKGSRPRAIHDQRTQSTYLFGAVGTNRVIRRCVSSCGWVALCERRRAGFARLSGWQPVGNWVVSAGEFSSIPVTRRRYPDNEQRIATHSLRRKMARSRAEP
jgi:hypothetical protein